MKSVLSSEGERTKSDNGNATGTTSTNAVGGGRG